MGRQLLLEREALQVELTELVERARVGAGAAVLLQGEAGVGKTTLQQAAAAQARRRGFSVVTGRGGELERQLGWGLLRELFVPVLRDSAQRAALLSDAAAVAGPLLGFRGGELLSGGESLLPEALNGFYWLVSNLCERGPLFIAVDDCHWVDRPSLQFLAYLARRVGDLRLVVCGCARPGEPGSEDGLADFVGRARSLWLEPLSAAASASLLAEALGADPSEALVAACHDATGGNPFLLRELALELRRAGSDPRGDAMPEIGELYPENVSQLVLGRLALLPDGAQRLARCAAVLGEEARLEYVAALAGLPLDEATEAVAGLARMAVLADGLPLVWRHPLVRNVLYRHTPAAERAQLHAHAAELARQRGEEPEQVAAHVLYGTRRSDPDVVDVLRRAAGRALARGAPAEAALYLARALEEPPPTALRSALLLDLGEAEAIAGSDTAVERLEQALDLLVDPGERARLLWRLGLMLHRAGRFGEASDVLERGLLELNGADARLASDLEAAYISTAWLHPDRAADAHRRTEALLAGGLETRGPAERTALSRAMLGATLAGESHRTVIEMASRLVDDGRLIDEEGPDSPILWETVGCLSWSDELDQAEEIIGEALEHARRQNSYVITAQMLYARAWPRFWRGRIADAVVDAQAAVEAWQGEWGLYLPAAMHWVAVGHIERGDLEAAGAALVLEDANRFEGTGPYAYLLAARGILAAARGDYAAALREHLAVSEVADALQVRNPALLPWRSNAALAALRLGDKERAMALAREEVELAREFGARRALGVALRAAGVVIGGDAGIELLREAVQILEASPSRLEYARALVEFGSAIRRAGLRREANQPLRVGLDLADRFGARVLAERSRSELAAMGLRPRRRRLTGPDSLTPGELRVCHLAAEGRTNREVAQRLLVSLRTVETHLTHAYRKLNIESRSDLADVLSSDGEENTTAGSTVS